MRHIVLALTLFILPIFRTSNANAAKEENVKIGVIAPLSGNAAHIGNEIQRTLQLLQRLLKDEPPKHQFEFVFEDGKAAMDLSPSTSAKKLIEVDGIKFLISATSGETLQVGPIAQRKGVLVVAVFSSHKDVKHLGDFVFRTFIDVEEGMARFAEWIRKKQGTPLILLTEDHVFTQGIKTLLVKYLKNDLAMAADYPVDTTDIRSLLTRVRGKAAKSIYFNCAHPRTCAIAINQARELGITATFYSYLHTDNPEFLEAAGKNADGVRFLSPPDIETSSADFQIFMEKYAAQYGEPTNEFLVRTTYDAARSIINGVDSVGPDPKLVAPYLLSYKGNGALGKISFDKNGDIQNIQYVVKEIRDGKPISLGE
jgi:branched-chain amino acid transport system substrate-binding protein